MSNFHFRLVSATLAGTALAKPRGATVTETVEYATSRAGGSVGPAARGLLSYDCECDIQYETGATPMSKTTAAGSMVLVYKDDAAVAVTMTIATMVAGAFSFDANSSPFLYTQKAHYVGEATNPISIA